MSDTPNPTPVQAFTTVVQKTADRVMTPNTKVAIPAIMLLAFAWWVLDSLRQSDLQRLELERKALQSEIAYAKEMAVTAKALVDGLVIRLATTENDAKHTGTAVMEIRQDIRGIFGELKEMRKEGRP